MKLLFWLHTGSVIMIRLLLAGGKPVIIEAKLDSDFKVSPGQIEAAITPQDKADYF